MLSTKCVLDMFLLLTLARISYTQRKIKDGANTKDDKKYMVYLLKANESPEAYDEWLCGGAIVSEKIIITSAACVEDVKYMYAIAGYTKYVKIEDIDTDPCTKDAKKKIVRSCVPVAYEFAHEVIEKWARIDIATAEVETPYDFTMPALPGCSYSVGKIPINYDSKYQKYDTDVFVLGWGHQRIYRPQTDTRDLNNELLIYGSTLILDKQTCKDMYVESPKILPIIDKYMICTLERGSLDDRGKLVENVAFANRDGCRRDGNENCEPGTLRKAGNLTHPEYYLGSNSTIDEKFTQSESTTQYSQSRSSTSYTKIGSSQSYTQSETDKPYTQSESNKSYTSPKPNLTVNTHDSRAKGINEGSNLTGVLLKNRSLIDITKVAKLNARKQGICQNDHGGPLVTWRGTEEILIGVASVFKVDAKSECVGPYLFTSTHCNSIFLDCILNGGKNIKRMGANGFYDYIVGSGPDPAYFEVPMYPDYNVEHDQVYDGRRDTGDWMMDKSKMASACQRPAAEMGFEFEFRRINWDSLNSGSEQTPVTEDRRPAEEFIADEIKIRPQIPLFNLTKT